jgi:hypothetical protein
METRGHLTGARATSLVLAAQLSYWDALILAGAQRSGARYLLSEDFQSARRYEDIQVLNPFEQSPTLFGLCVPHRPATLVLPLASHARQTLSCGNLRRLDLRLSLGLKTGYRVLAIHLNAVAHLRIDSSSSCAPLA